MSHKDYDRKGSVAKNFLVVNLKGRGANISNVDFDSDFNTSTVALRVVGGDENETQCLGL
jgi:hypothetical protein